MELWSSGTGQPNSAGQAVSTTPTAIVTCQVGQKIKLGSIFYSTGTTATTFTVDIDQGGTGYMIANALAIPANDSGIIDCQKIVLNENDAVTLTAGDNSTIECVITYDEVFRDLTGAR